eukprot:3161436-Karenia_brevis.AAC.1
MPLVSTVADRCDALVINPEKSYEVMKHRISKRGEDRFHFNGDYKNYTQAMLLLKAGVNIQHYLKQVIPEAPWAADCSPQERALQSTN